MEGIVVRVMGDKGFGFIRGEDNKEYFFHQSDLSGHFEDLAQDVREGRTIKVIYDSVTSQKGPRAGNVVRVDGGAPMY